MEWRYEMNRKRWIIGFSLLLLLIIGLSLLAWWLYSRIQAPAESPVNAIPDNTAIIIKINRPVHLWNVVNKENLMWRQIIRFPGMTGLNRELILLDSMFRQQLDISNIIQRYHLYIAITLSGRSSFGAIFLSSIPGSNPERIVERFIRDYCNNKAIVVSDPYAATWIHRVQTDKSSDPFFYAVYKGVFMASRHVDLVKKSIDRLSINAPTFTFSGFRKVEAMTGRKADANLFINFRFLSLFLYKQSRIEYVTSLLRLSRFADWCGSDLLVKKDELLLSGYTIANDTNLHFLALFDDQKPQPITIESILPRDVSWFIAFGYENSVFFLQQLHQRFQQSELQAAGFNSLTAFNERYGINLMSFFVSWIGKQTAVFSVKKPEHEEQTWRYAAVQCIDPTGSIHMLDSLCTRMNVQLDSVAFSEYQIYHVPFQDVLSTLFGQPFNLAGEQYCTLLGDFLVFGPDAASVRYLIDRYRAGLTLKENPSYKIFSAELSPNANIFLYVNPSNGIQTIRGLAGEGLHERLLPFYDSLRKFEGFALQFSNKEGQFYTSGFLRFNPSMKQEGPLQWETLLDSTITGKPQIMKASHDNPPVILVTDAMNDLYNVDASGVIRWKIHFMGRRLSDFIPIRLRAEDSLFYLFNTETHLYLVRSDGVVHERYPLRYPIPATNSIYLTDFGIPYNYSVFIALNDNRIYQFNLEGQSITTWGRPQLNEAVQSPISGLHTRGNDYLCMGDRAGGMMITKRSGTIAFRMKPPFIKAPHSDFYINKTNRPAIILTSDQTGRVIFIRDNGKNTAVNLAPFSPEHYFFYEDITGTDVPEFIFFDNNRLYYYTPSFRMIYTYTFPREIKDPPFLIRQPGGKTLIAITVPATRELFLFDGKGFHPLDNGIRGTTPFDIGFVDDPQKISLIVGDGRFLRNFRFTQR
jgi:hypothetical protein